MKNELKEELFIPKTKHKGLKITLAIVLIMAMGVGGYFLYQNKFNNPKQTIMNIIDSDIHSINNLIESDKNNKYKINGLIKLDATLPDTYEDLATIIRNIDLQFSSEVDLENKLGNIQLNTKYKDKKLLDITSIYENNTLYILLNDLYNKYIKISLNDINNKNNNTKIPEFNIEIKDIKVLYNSYYKALKEALSKLEYATENTKILIDGKELNVKNNYTVLKGNATKKFIETFLNILSNDIDFNNVLKKLKIENAFKELIGSLNEQILNNTIKINFYTKGIIKQELISEKFEFIVDNKTTEFKLDRINNDEKIIIIKSNDVDINIKIKKTNSVLNLNVIANILKTEIKFDFNANYEKINNITNIDVSNSININEITEETIKEIEEKTENNNALKALIEDINKIKLITE